MKQLFSFSAALLLFSCTDLTPKLSASGEREMDTYAESRKGIQTAKIFRKAANDTVGATLHVSVLHADNTDLLTREVGNAFIATGADTATKVDRSHIKTEWVSVDTLKILYSKKLRVLLKKEQAREAAIVYEEVE